jgi:tetratricopeptide (TPR) repeat protein|nr:tetratricopeptide repeat protein [Kofleriaceae bacterium]
MKGLAIIIAITASACGGHGGVDIKAGPKGPVAKLDPIKPAAQHEFEAAMRAMRLGGPDAPETARARLKHALEIDPTIWEAWHDLGVIAWDEGDDDTAIDAFTKALAIVHDRVPTLLARAEAYRRAGHKKEARSDYETALKKADEDDPNRRDAAARLASLLADDGEFDDAVGVLRDVVQQSGTNAKIYTALGMIYIAQKRYELAALVLGKAVELDAKDPAVYNALAILAMRQGKAQDAFDDFDHAVSLDASYIDARFNKASVLLDAGDFQRAKTELSAIVDKRPDDYAAQVSLGVADRGLKDYPEAKKVWERVINSAPKRSSSRADAMFDVAILEIEFMNDPGSGKAALERYLQEAPSGHAMRQAAEAKRKELGK